jgi:PPK2 family polyphosphate:nucleotide phosphotransferase
MVNMQLDAERFRVRPGERLRIADIDPDDGKRYSDSRSEIEATQGAEELELRELQVRLFAEKQQALLIVLLATDTGGKDSTISRIFSGINPQGCYVTGFGVPSDEERAHDFLWRVHQRVPRRGMIGIFNRSHYEDVTVVRVHGLIDRPEWEARFEHIRAFERLLHDSGTSIVKFHLTISKDEQASRLRDRLVEPEKHWKFNPNDLREREHWDDYQQAFDDAINATSTDEAPWFVVPANRKWYRDAIVTRVIVDRLRAMDPRFPPPIENIEDYTVE